MNRITVQTVPRPAPIAGVLPALLLGALFGTTAHGSEDSDSVAAALESEQAEKVIVVPYKTRPAPSHRVSLHDGRVYFLTEMEQSENHFVLHTLEGEVIEVDASEIAEVVEFQSE